MKKKPLYPFFLTALFFVFLNPFPLHFFAPFYAILYTRAFFINALWISAGCGLILDLLSTTLFPLHAIFSTMVTFFLYRYQVYFVDKPIGLFSYTLIISIFLTSFHRFSYFLLDPGFSLNFKGFVTDFLIFPLLDGIYALLFFSFPLITYRFIKKRGFPFHFFKKNSRKKKEETAHGT